MGRRCLGIENHHANPIGKTPRWHSYRAGKFSSGDLQAALQTAGADAATISVRRSCHFTSRLKAASIAAALKAALLGLGLFHPQV